MSLDTKKGYGFSTYYGISISTNMVTSLNQTLKNQTANDTNATTTTQLVFCDLFLRDPLYGIDVKMNTKHLYFMPQINSNNITEMKI